MTPPERDERVRAIAERCERATPGPWKLDNMCMYIRAADGSPVYDMYFFDDEENEHIRLLRLRGHGAEVSGHRPEGSQMFNARFVENARDDVPWLLAQLRARDSELAELRAVLAEFVHLYERMNDPRYDTPDLRNAYVREYSQAIDRARALSAGPVGGGEDGK